MRYNDLIVEKTGELFESSPLKISSKGFNTSNWYRFKHDTFVKGIMAAYDTSNIICNMLKKTPEKVPLSKNEKSYEDYEFESHQDLMRKIKNYANKFGIEVKHKDYSTYSFIDLEKKISEIMRRKYFDTNYYEDVVL